MESLEIEVIIPFYSNPEYLKLSIESVLLQTYRNFRIIVIDDCSPFFHIEDLVESYKDPRIAYQRNTSNLGVVRNFQFCLNQAKGDWFVMLGEDDLLHPSYLETLITSAIDNPKLAFIQPGVRVIDSEGQQIKTMTDTIKSLIKFLFLFSCSITSLRKRQVVISNGSRAIPWLFVGNFFYFPTIFWNTKIVRKFGFSDSYGITLDLEMILRILFHENGFLYCRDHLAQYRRHPSSVSNNPLNWYDRLNEEKKMIGGFINENEINAFNAFLGKLRISGRAHSLIRCIVELLRLNISLALKFFKLTFS